MHIFLIAALSADGYIAQDPTVPSTTWTSAEDKSIFKEITLRAGVLVIGRKTFETFGRALPDRKIIVLSTQEKPEKFTHIPDSSVEYRAATALALVEELSSAGQKELAVCGGSDIYSQFLEAGVVTTAYLTIEPVLFGSGTRLWRSDQPATRQLKLAESKQLNENGTLLLTYQVKDAT